MLSVFSAFVKMNDIEIAEKIALFNINAPNE